MSNISGDTFEALKHYVAVRLQQGVPLLDSDWNEAFDIRKFELETFLKWFVGDGVPRGNDGFAIAAVPGKEEDLLIKGGDGTPRGAGRCLVDGWEVLNESDLKYSEQPFDLPALNATDEDRVDLVYLDVWEHEVGEAEDPSIVNTDINLETCVRVKREWVVRVAEGEESTVVPEKFKEDKHRYYPLAQLHHLDVANGIPPIITDLRRTGLVVLSREITIEDGNVGIGTGDPRYALQVGDINTTGTWKLAVAGKGETGNWREWTFGTGDGDNASDIHKLRIRDEQADKERLVIDQDGHVGIGTSGPEQTLHVNGHILLSNGELIFKDNDDDIQSVLWLDANNDVALWNPVGGGDDDIYLGTKEIGGDNIRMVVKGNGQVGIGTTSPRARLEVRGSLGLSDDGNSFARIQSEEVSSDNYLTIKLADFDKRHATYPLPDNVDSITDYVFRIGHRVDFYQSLGDYSKYLGASFYSRFSIDQDGQVTIGTPHHDGGALHVYGPIYQKGNLLHADYVFEPDYLLESVEEHGEFMWKNKRLKAIPKLETDDNGQQVIDVGALSHGILEELEKAHIYIEELHKRLAALEKQVSKLEEDQA